MQCDKTELKVEVVRDGRALAALRAAWNRLLADDPTRTPELSYEWQTT